MLCQIHNSYFKVSLLLLIAACPKNSAKLDGHLVKTGRMFILEGDVSDVIPSVF